MTVSKEEIARIATLVAVSVDKADMEQLVRDIDSIVDFVGQLNTVDTDETLPPYRPGPVQAALRTDVVAPIPLARPIEEFAPQFRHGFFLVPRVVDGAGGE